MLLFFYRPDKNCSHFLHPQSKSLWDNQDAERR